MRKPSRKVTIIVSSALALLSAGAVAAAVTHTPEPKPTALSRDTGHFEPDLPQDEPAVETPVEEPVATPNTPVDQTAPVPDDAPAPDSGTRSETPRTDAPAPSQPPAPPAPEPPAPEPPAPKPPAPQPQPPAPKPVSVQTNSHYSPGCDYVTNPVYVHDPGAGGTSVVTLGYPWTYQISGTTVSVFACADW